MRPLKSAMLFLFICFITTLVDATFAQRLPEGAYHAIRERAVDIVHYKAELQLDLKNSRVFGESTIRFSPLRKTDNLSLDAIRLNVDAVRLKNASSQDLNFRLVNDSLLIDLGNSYTPAETLTVAVRYSCEPNAGMYFQPDMAHKGQYFVHTYGEGGLHANWLPIYNDVNDKFSTEMIVTVPESYSVISNGKLLGVLKADNGRQSFHWKQTLPHSNYLISIYAGLFEKGELPSAFGSIPLSYWVPKGRLQEGNYAFRNTTQMVEFFSRRFDYIYPWDKYDQIAIPDYAIGAMEHTGVTGHKASVLRDATAPLNFGAPDFNHYHTFWTADATIAHELAHHWFGDNLTCRNLSNIWLNESFASYCQMLWDEEDSGKETLLLDRQIALDNYLEYVAKEHTIRPLQYQYFDTPDDIYNEEHTYLKGAIVLHMLRSILGDDDFFRAISYYLKKHEYQNVESHDLIIAIGESTGQNLSWFFDDWVYGGGHPVFEVSYTYLANRKLLDLSVKQVQPIIEGQDLFRLPVTISIANSTGIIKHKVWVENGAENFLFESETAPLMVSFDGAGELVAELKFDKKIEELLYQIRHDDLPGQIWALRQLAKRFPTRNETVTAISEILAGDSFWGLKAEAALQLGSLRTSAAWEVISSALENPEYRIRKAAVLAMTNFSSSLTTEKLKNIITTDSHSDVVATALVALAKSDPDIEIDFIHQQTERSSWYSEITIARMNALGVIGNKNLVSEIIPFTTEKHNQDLRMAALNAWQSCAPGDSELHKTLLMSAEKAPYQLQQFAINMLGRLHVAQAKPLLQRIVEESGDVNITVLVQHALNQIDRIENFQK